MPFQDESDLAITRLSGIITTIERDLLYLLSLEEKKGEYRYLRVIEEDVSLTAVTGLRTFFISRNCKLVSLSGYIVDESSSGDVTIQLYDVGASANLLTSPLTILAGANVGALSLTSHIDLTAGDIIRVDCVSAGTGVKGLDIEIKII